MSLSGVCGAFSVQETRHEQWASQVIIPELHQIVLTSDRLNMKLEAVIALRKAQKPESAAVLDEIAATSTDQRVIDAITSN
jgi:site-specific recombinase